MLVFLIISSTVYNWYKDDKLYQMDLLYENSKNIDHLLINAGSVGQPRGMGIGYLILEILNNKLQKLALKK